MTFGEWSKAAGQVLREPVVWAAGAVKSASAPLGRFSLAAVLALATGLGVGFVGAQMLPQKPPVVTMPPAVEVKPLDMVHVQVATNNPAGLEWDTNAADAKLAAWPGTSSAVVQFPSEGKFWVKARTALGGKIACGEMLVTVGTPAPPVPPVPPVPPAPPAPIPEPGFRVLIVYKTADLSKMPAAQVNAIHSGAVRDYLDAKCAVGADGKTKEWRMWDADINPSAETALWQTAFKRAAGKTLPWVIVSNGTTGFEGALPADSDALLALLKKYGS